MSKGDPAPDTPIVRSSHVVSALTYAHAKSLHLKVLRTAPDVWVLVGKEGGQPVRVGDASPTIASKQTHEKLPSCRTQHSMHRPHDSELDAPKGTGPTNHLILVEENPLHTTTGENTPCSVYPP